MIIFLEDQKRDFSYYKHHFKRAGEALVRFSGDDFRDLVNLDTRRMNRAVEVVILDDVADDEQVLAQVVQKLDVPVIALAQNRDFENTRRLFHLGVDDVAPKPVHHEELLLRTAAVKRRMLKRDTGPMDNRITVHFDGRDPQFRGQQIVLPCRERRILEFLALTDGKRVTKAQVFDGVYGMFDVKSSDNVVETHICKLRKRLRDILGQDPINSRRHLGYQLDPDSIAA